METVTFWNDDDDNDIKEYTILVLTRITAVSTLAAVVRGEPG